MLTIDRAYFELTGGLERWLYRIVRKHGGRQEYGWSFDFRHLHRKSGSLSPLKHFAYDLRDIVRRQPLPGYRLALEPGAAGQARLSFQPNAPEPLATRRLLVHLAPAGGQAVNRSCYRGPPPVPSGTRTPCYREPESL